MITVNAEVKTKGSDSLQHILVRNQVPKRFDFLSIDVEGNDYNLWASLAADWKPRVVVIDFNPTVSNDVLFAQGNDPAVHRGASLRALIELGRLKEYALAAVTDWNAIFVRSDDFHLLDIGDNDIAKMYRPTL